MESSPVRYEACTPDVVSDVVDGELLIINLDSGAYFRGTGAAPAAWDLVTSGVAPEEAGDPRLAGFVDLLVEHGLVRERRRAPEAVDTTIPTGDLTLDRFDDLAELLALDPVHDVDPSGWPQAAPPGSALG